MSAWLPYPLGLAGLSGGGAMPKPQVNDNMDYVGTYQVTKNGNAHGAPSRFIVKLTEAETRIATWVGRQRRSMARLNNRDAGLGPSSTIGNADNDVRGALAEYAASIAFNLFWRPIIDQIDQKDIGGIVDVRTTILPTGRLIIKPADIKKSPDTPFVLVDCQSMEKGIFKMCGWRLAKEAPMVSQLDTKHGDPAYFISKNHLHSNESLVDWVSVRRVFD